MAIVPAIPRESLALAARDESLWRVRELARFRCSGRKRPKHGALSDTITQTPGAEGITRGIADEAIVGSQDTDTGLHVFLADA
jgi:hypothetical protein